MSFSSSNSDNSDSNIKKISSPYSNFYSSSDGEFSKENDYKNDPYNKSASSNVNINQNIRTEKPYMNYYTDQQKTTEANIPPQKQKQNVNQNYSANQNYSSKDNLYDQKITSRSDSNHSSNTGPGYKTNPYENINQPASQDEIKKQFIEKVKSDINLLPTEYKSGVKIINKLFVFSSCIYPVYFLYYVCKDYPNITEFSKKRLLLSSTLYFGLFFFTNLFFNSQYEKAYNNLRNKYSPIEIQKIIEEYHEVNTGEPDQGGENTNNNY